MNEQIQVFSRNWLKINLKKCSNKEQKLFKRMYSHEDIEKDIEKVIDDIKPESLEWAMAQVQRTLKQKEQNVQS